MKVFFATAIVFFVFSGCGNLNDRSTGGSVEQKAGDVKTVGGNPTPPESASEKDAVPVDKNAPSGFESVYTDLAENKCTNLDSNEDEAWSVQSCPGFGGYGLIGKEGDLRQTIDVVAPDKTEHELELWSVVSSGFSMVGDKAEWRFRKVNGKNEPFALIIRYKVSENPEDANEVTSYLTVSKLTPTEICVTDIVKPVANANQIARDLADRSAKKPCLKTLSN